MLVSEKLNKLEIRAEQQIPQHTGSKYLGTIPSHESITR